MTHPSVSRAGGGIAGWSIRHPIGVSMIALAVIVLGLFAVGRLPVDLLPKLIYPEIRIRILDPGVPARIMEDQVTRQLEEQLAITEDAIGVQSRTGEGSSSVDLAFEYGKDIDIALRDASTRLDRAKRFLPDSIDPPVIFKRDPSQIPVTEFVISSTTSGPVALREWVDYEFARQFLNLPGVAAVEVGGGLLREIQVLPDPQRIASVGLAVGDLIEALRLANAETPAGTLYTPSLQLSGRTAGRFQSVEEIAALPIRLADGTTVRLDELGRVLDTHTNERIRARLNGVPGVKVSIQKQPAANTVAVVDAVDNHLKWLRTQGLMPADVEVQRVADQAVHVRNALNNTTLAALSGTTLAMIVVYLFLGNLRRTLIIGSAIPLAVMVTFVLMGAGGLTFNIMTLGGLALGVGMLVDNTIVMLENIHRHQRAGEAPLQAGQTAAAEIHSAIIAATSTNLAAVLPFLFVSGLIGLLFRELIFTISAAILASLVVALTLVPALGVRVGAGGESGRVRRLIDGTVEVLQQFYGRLVAGLLASRSAQVVVVLGLVAGLVLSAPVFTAGKQEFLPKMDQGEIIVSLVADSGIALEEMDAAVRRLEGILHAQPEVETVFTLVGGFIFGRTEREASNRSTITLQLVPRHARSVSSEAWIKRVQKLVDSERLAGVEVRMRTRGIRGVRIGRGDDDLSLRIQGPDLDTLTLLGDAVVHRLQGVPGLRNLTHSAEERRQEIALRIDRRRAADLGLDATEIGRALRAALEGEIATSFLDGDRSHDIRVRLPRGDMNAPVTLEQLVLFTDSGSPVRLGDLARVELVAEPAEILRDRQRRIVEITGSLTGDATLGAVYADIEQRLENLELPPGYVLFDGGELKTLQEGRGMGQVLLALALFLVFVVMAVQYESVRNPFVILLSVPFAAIGVAIGLTLLDLPLSMPVWLGMIMLAGIVVNNAIVLVEYIELSRARGLRVAEAIVDAARLRLRPILMTTLTTACGMLPLALGVGEGSEMLRPLAVTLIAGLTVSLVVTLALIPIVYRLFHPEVRS